MSRFNEAARTDVRHQVRPQTNGGLHHLAGQRCRGVNAVATAATVNLQQKAIAPVTVTVSDAVATRTTPAAAATKSPTSPTPPTATKRVQTPHLSGSDFRSIAAAVQQQNDFKYIDDDTSSDDAQNVKQKSTHATATAATATTDTATATAIVHNVTAKRFTDNANSNDHDDERCRHSPLPLPLRLSLSKKMCATPPPQPLSPQSSDVHQGMAMQRGNVNYFEKSQPPSGQATVHRKCTNGEINGLRQSPNADAINWNNGAHESDTTELAEQRVSACQRLPYADHLPPMAADDFVVDHLGEDPYAELEQYLERVKKEINEVFDQLNIPHDNDDDSTTMACRNGGTSSNSSSRNITEIDVTDQSRTMPLARHTPQTPRTLRTLRTPTTVMAAATTAAAAAASEAATTTATPPTMSGNSGTDNCHRRGRRLTVTDCMATRVDEAIPPYMDIKEFNNVRSTCGMDTTTTAKNSTITLATAAAAATATPCGNHHRPAMDTTGTTKLNSNNRSVHKPEKHTIVPSARINQHTTNTNWTDNYTKTTNGNDQCFLELKIDEDKLDMGDEDNILKRHDNFATHWTSDESILRVTDILDEDNKSTSSSACEDDPRLLSSGKSGNSMGSSELDNENAESGIGTATPPKDHESWHSKSDEIFLTHPEKKPWMFDSNESNAINSPDDPDTLDVLSLFDGTNAEDYDFSIESDDNKSVCLPCDEKSLNTSFGTDFSSSTNKSIESDGEPHLLFHRNGHTLSSTSLNRRLPNVPSFPLNISERRWSALKFPETMTACNSLPRDNAANNEPRRPFCLPISQESIRHTPSYMAELPSPSSASLHNGHVNLILQELTTKSNSAPVLQKKEAKRDDFAAQTTSLRYSRSQSDRYLAEIEAIEACKWLRAAGFPQYAQMYEDLQFPIELSNVAKDHPFLENDPLQSLYRRLVALNRCASMRLDQRTHKHVPPPKPNEDSDDDSCALSENWTFQPQSRRWSRVGEMGVPLAINIPPSFGHNKHGNEATSNESSFDRLSTPNERSFCTSPKPLKKLPLVAPGLQGDQVKFRRTGSERLRDGAKAFLRRVESIKTRRKKRQNREGVIISGPHFDDLSDTETSDGPLNFAELSLHPHRNELTIPKFVLPSAKSSTKTDLKFVPLSPSPRHIPVNRSITGSHSNRTSPLHFYGAPINVMGPSFDDGKSGDDDSSSYGNDTYETSTEKERARTESPSPAAKKRPSRRRLLQRGGTSKADDVSALSDSECHKTSGRSKKTPKETCSSNTETDVELKVPGLSRGGSLNLGRESKKYREAFQTRRSFRSRSSTRVESGSEQDDVQLRASRSPVMRWHSFQTADITDDDSLLQALAAKRGRRAALRRANSGKALSELSSGQLQVVRKLALVTLTGYMERYCPTHRSGWNWELPKFIKKIKSPDYKDKKVFGVPLLLILQRSGQTLPQAIAVALKWLRTNALDQVGLFRKSGVKSRILKLKTTVEAGAVDLATVFDDQQAYDVADMVKQFFRDLPECLLTSKLSETFIGIFQHLPADVRADAIQSAVLLLPDENREVLAAILDFLAHVAEHASINQMTANNLAVCLAPSLFHTVLNARASTTSSPRHRSTKGGSGDGNGPGARELLETRASHECLAFLITNHRTVFAISAEHMAHCNFGYMEESRPVPLSSLGEGLQVHDWRGYLYECTSATIKEAREKSRGWMSVATPDANVDVAYKKVGDGHPLRLWRGVVSDVDATPDKVLHHILRERAIWDQHMLMSRVVERLDDRAEVFQYASGGAADYAVTDYCVLRSWRTDLPRGACVIVETSVEHSDATPMLDSVRGVVLASRYLIEPCGNGKSRIMHLARVDAKGRTPDWYNKCYAHIVSQQLWRIRNKFKRTHTGGDG